MNKRRRFKAKRRRLQLLQLRRDCRLAIRYIRRFERRMPAIDWMFDQILPRVIETSTGELIRVRPIPRDENGDPYVMGVLKRSDKPIVINWKPEEP